LYWVRLNGIFQFKAASRGDLGVDVVLDISTTVRPGELGYPLNAGRDAFVGAAYRAFQAVVNTVERENLSVAEKKEDEVFADEGEPDDEVSAEAHTLLKAFEDDPEYKRLLGMPQKDRATAHDAEDDEPAEPERDVLKTNLPDEFEIALPNGRIPQLPRGLQTPEEIRAALLSAEDQSNLELIREVEEALDQVATGSATVGEIRIIAKALDRAARVVAHSRGDDSRAPQRGQGSSA
jgi:hypothetical protein